MNVSLHCLLTTMEEMNDEDQVKWPLGPGPGGVWGRSRVQFHLSQVCGRSEGFRESGVVKLQGADLLQLQDQGGDGHVDNGHFGIWSNNELFAIHLAVLFLLRSCLKFVSAHSSGLGRLFIHIYL